jgi:hypothetical protein
MRVAPVQQNLNANDYFLMARVFVCSEKIVVFNTTTLSMHLRPLAKVREILRSFLYYSDQEKRGVISARVTA